MYNIFNKNINEIDKIAVNCTLLEIGGENKFRKSKIISVMN